MEEDIKLKKEHSFLYVRLLCYDHEDMLLSIFRLLDSNLISAPGLEKECDKVAKRNLDRKHLDKIIRRRN